MTTPETPTTDEDLTPPGVEFVGTGWTRCQIGDRTVRLRPPFFGEFRRFRTGWEDAADLIEMAALRAEQEAALIVRDEQALRKNRDGMAPDEYAAAVAALRSRATKAGRAANAEREETTIRWWLDVVSTLAVDGPVTFAEDLEDVPAWMTDPVLPSRAIQHWRSVPLGRG